MLAHVHDNLLVLFALEIFGREFLEICDCFFDAGDEIRERDLVVGLREGFAVGQSRCNEARCVGHAIHLVWQVLHVGIQAAVDVGLEVHIVLLREVFSVFEDARCVLETVD